MNQDQFLKHLMPLQPQLQLVAELLLGSETEAEDAVQDTVLTLWQRRNELDRVVNIEGFAMQTLKNHCITQLRHRKPAAPVESLENVEDEAAVEVALMEERASLLDRMMEQLPEVQRQAVRMRYIEQLPHEEIQRRLGISSSNVYTTISRAVSALKQMAKQ